MPNPAEPMGLAHGRTWRNRIAMAPLTNCQSHADGTLSHDEIEWLTARAQGEFGLVMTAAAFVAPAGHVWEGQLGIASDDHLPELQRLAQNLRNAGACSAVQLHHGGRRAERRIIGRAAQCPWDDPAHDAVAMTGEEIQTTVADFVAAAVLAERAGFDGVEVHGAHGYLIGQFLDSTRNHRSDEYGGTLDNRFRILAQVLAGIRAATGEGFQLGLRLSPEGFGIPLQDGREYARRALETGLLDYLELSLWDVFMQPRKGGDGLLIDHFVDLPRGATRLGVAGKVLATEDAQWCLDKGADFVSVGRGSIVHHDFAARALANADFHARPLPVPVEVLMQERVGPAFVDYLLETFPDVVKA
ncbi:MAG: NADH:flavin oxidoreductase [Candidatus Nanopelagicales bacterium]|nr:NADH:flavin oxidoreductase [Candidatus Nanopelagicales bacterium]